MQPPAPLEASPGAPSSLANSTAAYAVYFDYQRRANPEFRKNLHREARRQARAEKEKNVAVNKRKSQEVHAVIDDAIEEGFPTGVNEKEQFFMDHVQQGELLAADRKSSPVPYSSKDSTSCFIESMGKRPRSLEDRVLIMSM